MRKEEVCGWKHPGLQLNESRCGVAYKLCSESLAYAARTVWYWYDSPPFGHGCSLGVVYIAYRHLKGCGPDTSYVYARGELSDQSY